MINVKESKARRLLTIPVELIAPNRYQPRRIFDQDELAELAESIKQNGMIQPITVREVVGTYEIIAGERRLRAAKLAKFKYVPCLVIEADDNRSAAMAVVENIQRANLNCFEQADGIAVLIRKWGITQRQAAERLGKSQSAVANKLRLLRLTPSQRERIIDGRLTERHARALLRVGDDSKRNKVLDAILKKGLNVAQTEEFIDKLQPPRKPVLQVKRVAVIKDVRLFINTVSKAADTMRRSGLDVQTAKRETDEHIEYKILIPKTG